MKRIFIFLITLLSISVSSLGQNYWIRIQSPTSYELFKIVMVDSMNIWIAGDSATLFHSSNGGINWVFQNSTLAQTYRFNDLFFLNKRFGWAVAYDLHYGGTQMLKTTNGGNNWINLNMADTAINTVCFIDSLKGFYGEWYGANIYNTTNAGLNWYKSEIDSAVGAPKNHFNFYNSQIGICCGGLIDAGGPIWKTTDSGLNWYKCFEAGVPMFDIIFLDFNHIIAAGGEFDIGATFTNSTNNGSAWSSLYYGILAIGKSMAVRTRSEYWVPLGFHGGWEATFDSARTWSIIQSDSNIAINDTRFSDPYHGWAIGVRGSIFKFNKDVIGIHNPGTIIPINYKLYQNYPNPFNPSTTINYEIPLSGDIKITVFDMTGKKVCILVEGRKDAGKYQVIFDGSNLPSGVYFYQLTSGNYSASKKMILLK